MKLKPTLNLRKNGAVIAVITLLLCVAVYLNWSYSRDLDIASDAAMGAATASGDDATAASGDDAAAASGDDAAAASGDDAADVDADTLPASDAARFDKYAWVLGSDGNTASSGGVRVTQLSEYFDRTRLERQQSKDEALSILQSTLADDNVSTTAKTDAETSIAAMAANAVSESRIESLVMAKGFLECVAIIDGRTVSVVVLPEEEGLLSTDVAKIKDIVIAETAVTADKIRIIEAS